MEMFASSCFLSSTRVMVYFNGHPVGGFNPGADNMGDNVEKIMDVLMKVSTLAENVKNNYLSEDEEALEEFGKF